MYFHSQSLHHIPMSDSRTSIDTPSTAPHDARSPFQPIRPNHLSGPTPHGNGHRPLISFDSSDSSSGDSSTGSSSPSSDRFYSPYTDEPKSNADPHLQSATEKRSRRVHFDYGITAPPYESLSPMSCVTPEDNNDIQIIRDSSLPGHTRLNSLSHSLPWELPFPVSHARPTMGRKVDTPCEAYPSETSSFFHSQPFWIVLYFFFNLGLTLYNKAVLIHFPYGYALTALHALCGSIGGFTLLRLGVYVPKKLSHSDNMALLAFSLLYSINIAVSNLSLQLVTIPVSPINSCFMSR